MTEPLERGFGARHRPRPDLRSARPPLAVTALRVREDRALLLVRDLVELSVVGAGCRALPEQDRHHSWAHHGRAVLGSPSDRPIAVRVEAVTEGARSAVREEAVLALPTAAVARVVCVDEDVAAPA